MAESTLYDWLRQERAEGRRRPRPHAGERPRVIDAEGEAVYRLTGTTPGRHPSVSSHKARHEAIRG